jgi:uncharacterized membrane protein
MSSVVDRGSPEEFLTAAEEHVAPHTRRLWARSLGERLRESLLFLPVVLLLAAGVVEQLAAAADRRLGTAGISAVGLPPDAAVALLATIAGATITTAGVVFSLLVVTLQLVSGQFSPRVLRTFWRDRFGQVLIGLLLATFVFCVLALTQIDTTADHAPVLTVLLALLLAFASILAIVVYLNRITRQQYVGRLLEGIAAETIRLVHNQPSAPAVQPPDTAALGTPLVVHAAADGWVQQLSFPAMAAASPPGSVVRVETRCGAYLVTGEAVATIWPPAGQALSARQAGKVTALVRNALVQGHARTMQQDIDFGLRQLVDIALRALSPAVNDPTTAIEAVLRVASVMRRMVQIELRAQAVRTAGGGILLTPWELDHEEYVTHAFSQLRHYGASHPQVALAIVRSLRMLRQASTQAAASQALDHQLELTLRACERAGLLPEDLDKLRHAATA